MADVFQTFDTQRPVSGSDARAPLPLVGVVVLSGLLVVLYGTLPSVLLHQWAQIPVWPAYFTLYALVSGLISHRASEARTALGAAAVPLLFSALPLLSTAWSVVPQETAMQALTLIGTAVTGFALASIVPPLQALRLMAVMASIGPALDLATVVAVPSIGIHQDGPWEATWKGLHDQKNGLGAYSTLAILVLLVYARSVGHWSLIRRIALLISLLLLVMARSTTSWLTALACIPLVLIGPRLQRVAAFAVPIGLAVFVAVIIISPDFGTAMLDILPALVGKDSTLSNRLPIWTAVEPYIEQTWWLGYGYASFWNEAVLPSEMFQSRMYFVPASAHSSYFELRLGLGVVGAVAAGAVLLYTVAMLWRAHARMRASDHNDPILPLALPLLLYLALQSLTESVVLTRNDIVWVMFVWLTTHLAVVSGRSIDHHQGPSWPNAELPPQHPLLQISKRRLSIA
jgi:exopolysaccharide production protein ExoQ